MPVLRDDVDIIGAVLPELLPMVGFRQNNPHHCKDVWEHTLTVLQNVPPEPELRWAALLHDVEKPACCTVDEAGIRHFKGHQEKGAQTAERILRRLHCETRFITGRGAGASGGFCSFWRCAVPIRWDRLTPRRRSPTTVL